MCFLNSFFFFNFFKGRNFRSLSSRCSSWHICTAILALSLGILPSVWFNEKTWSCEILHSNYFEFSMVGNNTLANIITDTHVQNSCYVSFLNETFIDFFFFLPECSYKLCIKLSIFKIQLSSSMWKRPAMRPEGV